MDGQPMLAPRAGTVETLDMSFKPAENDEETL